MMRAKLVLIIAPGLEEDLVDLLLALPAVDGFTSFVVQGNGKQQNMSLAEQVTGRRRRLRFELVLEAAKVDGLLRDLRERLGNDTVYWVETLSGFGKLGELPP
jgi:hypothetical protein